MWPLFVLFSPLFLLQDPAAVPRNRFHVHGAAMVASAVSVHDGMTLDALAAAAKSADIRICLTPT